MSLLNCQKPNSTLLYDVVYLYLNYRRYILHAYSIRKFEDMDPYQRREIRKVIKIKEKLSLILAFTRIQKVFSMILHELFTFMFQQQLYSIKGTTKT